MIRFRSVFMSLGMAAAATLIGCGQSDDANSADTADTSSAHSEDHDHDHDHADDHDHDHGHEEVLLGTTMIGEMEVQCWQGHGSIEPGKELHLVVKLAAGDGGASIVRAWIGTEDRFESIVARGEYAASHDDYDIHATAPDPLPENAMWWIEVEHPDGTKHLGSIAPR